MRVCMIGNSHIAAIKVAWPQIRDELPGVEVDFFASWGSTLKELHADGRSLTSDNKKVRQQLRMTSGKSARIDVDAYDLFLLFSLEFGVRPLVELYRSHRHIGHRSRLGNRTLISKECFKTAVQDVLSETVAYDVVSKLRQLTDRPIVLSEQPGPSETISRSSVTLLDKLLRRPPKGNVWFKAVHDGDDAGLAELYVELRGEFERSGIRVLKQPESTKAGRIMTKALYGKNAPTISLEHEHQERDHFHMNKEYGLAVLRDMVDRGLFQPAVSGVAGGEDATTPSAPRCVNNTHETTHLGTRS